MEEKTLETLAGEIASSGTVCRLKGTYRLDLAAAKTVRSFPCGRTSRQSSGMPGKFCPASWPSRPTARPFPTRGEK